MAGDRPQVNPALRRQLTELARADTAELLAEAQAAARARAKALIEDALVEELLGAAGAASTQRNGSNQAPPIRIGPGQAPERHRSGPTQDTEGHAWWAYCVLDAQRAADASGLEGIDPAGPVEAVIEGGLAAMVSRVPLAEFGDDTLREHLEDIEWLERIARAHEAVLEGALSKADIVPLRLCTLYRDLDGVRAALRERAGALASGLAAVDGASEWGVKVFLVAERAAPAAAAEQLGSSSGAAYLADRQRERRLAEGVHELCASCSEEVHRTIAQIARQERLNPVQRPEAHGRQAEMILNAAYLVDSERAEDLRRAVGQLDERWEPEGLAVELTGPWPPYNFIPDAAEMIQ